MGLWTLCSARMKRTQYRIQDPALRFWFRVYLSPSQPMAELLRRREAASASRACLHCVRRLLPRLVPGRGSILGRRPGIRSRAKRPERPPRACADHLRSEREATLCSRTQAAHEATRREMAALRPASAVSECSFRGPLSPSTRSRARPVGRCTLKPTAAGNRHTELGTRCTPNFSSIKVPMRLSVHISVEYPAAIAPCFNSCASSRAGPRRAAAGGPARHAGRACRSPPLGVCVPRP